MWETVPCCDDCWWEQGLGDGGIGARLPYRFVQKAREEEHCHFCGFTTLSGIYVRTNVLEKPAAKHQTREGLGT